MPANMTCPMHPEIRHDRPGSCPKGGKGPGPVAPPTPAGFENRVRFPDASADRPIRAGKLSNLRDDAGTARPERRRGEVAGAVRHDAALLDKHRTRDSPDRDRNVRHDSGPAASARHARLDANVA